jgi:hypothetical protein
MLSAAVVGPSVVAWAAPTPAAPPACSHLRVVDADADARDLLARVGDVVSEDIPALDVGMSAAFPASSLFRLDDPEAACLSAWVIVEPSRALIRVAGPRRCRFVFREVAVEHPLSELDRERVAQVAKAAIAAVNEETSGACEQPPAPIVVTPPPVVAVPQKADTPLASEPAPVAVASTAASVRSPIIPDWSRIVVGVNYGGQIYTHMLWDGPAVSLSLAGSSWQDDPELWVELRYVLAKGFNDSSIQTSSGRAGLSVKWWRLQRIGLGLGADRDLWAWPNLTNTPNWRPAARAFTTIVSPSWKGISVGATVFLDAVHSADPGDTLRPGFSLEVSSR